MGKNEQKRTGYSHSDPRFHGGYTLGVPLSFSFFLKNLPKISLFGSLIAPYRSTLPLIVQEF